MYELKADVTMSSAVNHCTHPSSAPPKRPDMKSQRYIPERYHRDIKESNCGIPRVLSTSALRIPKQRTSFWQRYCSEL